VRQQGRHEVETLPQHAAGMIRRQLAHARLLDSI
jgi:hypothetical protein